MTVEYRWERRPFTLNAERKGTNHWTKTRQLTREWREAFWALGLQNRQRMRCAAVEVAVVIKGPMQDTGACFPTVKAAIDGLVDAGILPNDGPEQIASLTFLAPRKPNIGEPESLTLRLTPIGER